jgi:hypothetical protein
MKTYRFVTTAHYDVSADTLEDAMETFREIKQKEPLAKVDSVCRVEVNDEKGEYVPVDHPLRAEYLH